MLRNIIFNIKSDKSLIILFQKSHFKRSINLTFNKRYKMSESKEEQKDLFTSDSKINRSSDEKNNPKNDSNQSESQKERPASSSRPEIDESNLTDYSKPGKELIRKMSYLFELTKHHRYD
jgi:hypothetical protein